MIVSTGSGRDTPGEETDQEIAGKSKKDKKSLSELALPVTKRKSDSQKNPRQGGGSLAGEQGGCLLLDIGQPDLIIFQVLPGNLAAKADRVHFSTLFTATATRRRTGKV
jgi:hypothetical protein